MNNVFIGSAGWSIPSAQKHRFSDKGTHLEKYSERLNCVEINSSFYKEHNFKIYKKWSGLVPPGFLFSVKLSKYFTHVQRLVLADSQLEASLDNIDGLGKKLGLLLVQLPPSLEFDFQVAEKFISILNRRCRCPILFEPRHMSWSTNQALSLLEQVGISKALADPEPCKISKTHRARLEQNIRYFRLHGKPKTFKSNYETKILNRLHSVLRNPISPADQTWVIFNNTMYGHGTSNALELSAMVAAQLEAYA